MNDTNEKSTPVEEERPSTGAPEPATAPVKSGSKLWVVLIVLVVVLGVAIGYAQGLFGTNTEPADDAPETSMEQVDPSTVVATVNGVDITRGELDLKIAQVRNTMPAGSVDPTRDAAFEQVVLDEMINVNILLAKADEQGYTTSEEDIDAEIETLISLFGGEEAFNTQLSATGITREELRTNMHNEIRIRMLVSEATDIESVEVTDEEVQLAYDTAVGDSPEAASIEEVRELLRTQLIQQKSTAIIDTYIQELRGDADVVVNL